MGWGLFNDVHIRVQLSELRSAAKIIAELQQRLTECSFTTFVNIGSWKRRCKLEHNLGLMCTERERERERAHNPDYVDI